MSSSKTDRFTSNQDQNDHSTHIVEYISPVKMLRFVIICNYPGVPHVVSAIWPCTWLFNRDYYAYVAVTLSI